MKHRIHVDQHAIRRNRTTGSRDPVVLVKTYKASQRGHEAVVRDPEGQEILRVVYRPDNPLSCGAVVWVEVAGPYTVETVSQAAVSQEEPVSSCPGH